MTNRTEIRSAEADIHKTRQTEAIEVLDIATASTVRISTDWKLFPRRIEPPKWKSEISRGFCSIGDWSVCCYKAERLSAKHENV